jgi:hypothetical protein
MVINLEQFLRQERDFQIDLALLHEVVATRVTKTYLYTLYQIQGFYVELKFHRQYPDREVVLTRAFEDTNLLLPYLKHIDISGLFS